jgi:hypothetical protein
MKCRHCQKAVKWHPIDTCPNEIKLALLLTSVSVYGERFPIIGYRENSDKCWRDDDGAEHYVTHWMPIPEDPK